MGYQTNIAPPRPWFCGHVYLKQAKQLMESIPADSKNIHDLTKIVAARLNIMRGIRVALKLLPEDYEAKDILMEGLEDCVEAERLASLKANLLGDFRYHIGGTGQYGVPNYSIHDKSVPDSSFSVLADDGKNFLGELIAERVMALNRIMDNAKDIFFWDVYVPENRHEIHYYDIREYMDETDLIERIIEFGLAKDEAEVRRRWGEAIERDNCNIDGGGEVDQAFYRLNEESFYDIVNDDFGGVRISVCEA